MKGVSKIKTSSRKAEDGDNDNDATARHHGEAKLNGESLADLATPRSSNQQQPRQQQRRQTPSKVSTFSPPRSKMSANGDRKRNDMNDEHNNPQDGTTLLELAASHESDLTKVIQNVAGTKTAGASTKKIPSKPSIPNKPNSKKWKRRKRGRYTRIALLDKQQNGAHQSTSNGGAEATNVAATASASEAAPASSSSLSSSPSGFPPLPKNQYRTTLRRRAIRKLDDTTKIPSPRIRNDATATTNGLVSTFEDEDNQRDEAKMEEEYGDTSLGMKLIVVGGRVIVQLLNPMSDGRASPAQLVGVIERGDVLLSIDNYSLVDLPIDKLMEGLRPLSTPDANGAYARILNLRFESAAGLELLKSHEEGQFMMGGENGRRRISGGDPANDMFSLFPMVDQLSGAPLFAPSDDYGDRDDSKERPEESKQLDATADDNHNEQTESPTNVIQQFSEDTDAAIANGLAQSHQHDKQLFTSEFFSWNDDTWEWLRSQRVDKSGDPLITGTKDMQTPTERIEQGTKTLQLFNKMSYKIEEMSKGKDMRSFKLWNSSLSLQSGASRRRRFVFDSVSLPAHRLSERFERDTIEESDEEDASLNSDGSGSMDEVDGDELLLGLAAHDEIWRKQVIETLETAIDEMENGDTAIEEEEVDKPKDMNSAISSELGAFLFGENISRVIKKKKSHALPPDEVTSVLFDLTTNLTTSAAPDEISFSGQQSMAQSQQSSLGYHALSTQRRKSQNAEAILATEFLLNQSLPIWLNSFRPLPWEHRRVLWPRVKAPGGSSHLGGATIFSDDSLTVDSGETGRSATAKRKSIQEIIEDQELDVEARAETCFLVTFYFTQKLLPAWSAQAKSSSSGTNAQESKDSLDEATSQCISFIQKYGSYLQMQASLSYAAAVRAERIITELLNLALNDVGHKDAWKEIQKANTLMFYNSSKLSAVVMSLENIQHELRQERRRVLANLAVTAYPDIRPWQVRKACQLEGNESSGNGGQDGTEPSSTNTTPKKKNFSKQLLKDLFYTYLSQLLDPMDGHSHARRDLKLVEEYCNLSVESIGTPDESKRLKNFYDIASKTSSTHLSYRRDLVMLLDIAMRIHEQSLALDLATEIIESQDPTMKTYDVLQHLVSSLRDLYRQGVESAKSSEHRDQSFKLLSRIVKLFQRMDRMEKSAETKPIIVVPMELYKILEMWQTDLPPQDGSCHPRMMELIHFLSNNVEPVYMLRMFVLWSDDYDMGPALYGIVQKLLRTGSQSALEHELSGSLLRLKYERVRFNKMNQSNATGIVVGIGDTDTTNGKNNSSNSNNGDDNSMPGALGDVVIKNENQLWRLMSAGGLNIDK